jgi:hypothetical protein
VGRVAQIRPWIFEFFYAPGNPAQDATPETDTARIAVSQGSMPQAWIRVEKFIQMAETIPHPLPIKALPRHARAHCRPRAPLEFSGTEISMLDGRAALTINSCLASIYRCYRIYIENIKRIRGGGFCVQKVIG